MGKSVIRITKKHIIIMIMPWLVLYIWQSIPLIRYNLSRKPYEYITYNASKNISDYPMIRERVLWEPVRSLLPDQIPMNPNVAKLDYWEPVSSNPDAAKLNHIDSLSLHPHGHFQLRLKLPPTEIEQLYAKFDKIKIAKYKDFAELIDSKRYDFTLFFTSDTKEHVFPDDYMFMVLIDDVKRTTKGLFDYAFGIAISKQRNEIVYWLNTKNYI